MFKHLALFVASILVLVLGTGLEFGFNLAETSQLAVVVWAGVLTIFILRDMIQDIRRGSYGIDILAISAIWATILAGQPIASGVIMVMLTGGQSLESYANQRAKRELTRLMDRRPGLVHVLRGKELLDIPANDLKIGDAVKIKTGEMVPVDGNLVSAGATLDTSSITGEAVPVSLGKDEKVISGSVNEGEAFEMKVTAGAQESEYGQILKLVKELEDRPAHFVRLADRYAVPFTIAAFIIAGVAWVLSGDFMRFAMVLVVASPCPLILAAPVAFMSGMSRASRNGIIVKDGTVLERLARIAGLAFDKTGTLSRGEVVVSEVRSLDKKFSERDILRIIAESEMGSSHILARSVVSYAKRKGVKFGQADKVADHEGRGVDAVVDGKKVVIGSLAHLKDHKIKVPGDVNLEKSAIFLAIDGKTVGVVTFRDVLRKDAKEVVSEFRTLGISDITMITGDAEAAARIVAQKVGIERYFAESLPADKVRIVEEELKKPTAFVGDGVNDAPVLAAADVGLAMGAFGSTAATESADVVIMSDDLERVPTAVKIAKRTLRIGKQSTLIGVWVSIGLMVVASFGAIPVIIGALLQEGLDVASILNALRARR